MVTANVNSAAREIQDTLEARDIQGLAVIAVSTAGGVVVAQEIADRALPVLGFSRNPSSATGFAASAGVKALTALVAGAGITAAGLTGLPFVVVIWIAVGHVAAAGADLINAVQRTGLAAEAPRQRQASGQGTDQTAPQPASTGSAGGQAASVNV